MMLMSANAHQVYVRSSPTHTRHQSSSSLLNYSSIPVGMIGSTIQLPTSSTSNHPVGVTNQISTIQNSGTSASSNNLQQMGQQISQQQQQQQPHSSVNYPEDFYANPTEIGDVGQSEHYIYVTYPPELKRRLLERYGKDIYLMLLKKDGCE